MRNITDDGVSWTQDDLFWRWARRINGQRGSRWETDNFVLSVLRNSTSEQAVLGEHLKHLMLFKDNRFSCHLISTVLLLTFSYGNNQVPLKMHPAESGTIVQLSPYFYGTAVNFLLWKQSSSLENAPCRVRIWWIHPVFVLQNVPKTSSRIASPIVLLMCVGERVFGGRRRELESILGEKGYPTIFMILRYSLSIFQN
jgi:hypothetical protein